MKIYLLATIAVMTGVLLFSGCSPEKEILRQTPLKGAALNDPPQNNPGDQKITQEDISESLSLAPDFSLKDISGNNIMLSDFRNKKPLILVFWTIRCPICREELEKLNEIYPTIEKDGFEVLAINIGEPKYRVEAYAKNHRFKFKVLLDSRADTAYDYELMGVPTYVIIDKKGRAIINEYRFPRNYKNLVSP